MESTTRYPAHTSALIHIIIIASAGWLTKKKPNPLLCGLVFGVIKAILGFPAIPTLINTVFVGVLFGATGGVFFLLLSRLGKKPNPADDPSTAYSAAARKSRVSIGNTYPSSPSHCFSLRANFCFHR